MTNTINSILIHEIDNVATAIADFNKGEAARYAVKSKIVIVEIKESIPQYHKFAIRDIPKGGRIFKYGDVIGEAVQDIRRGSHVHVHNIVSPASGDGKIP